MRPFNWNPESPPFSFKYDGRPSAEFLAGWERDETPASAPGDPTRYSYRDPDTGLVVTAFLKKFSNSDAVDWVLEFANEGDENSLILENILPLDLSMPLDLEEKLTLHTAKGSQCMIDDFLPVSRPLPVPGTMVAPSKIDICGREGRSSDTAMPFANLQGVDGGAVLGIGWTGQWAATYERTAESVRICAGMERTHLRLYPGERIRTPRILWIDWRGDDHRDGYNALRRVLMDYYCPRIGGDLVVPPVAHMTMSTFHQTAVTSEETELKALRKAADIGVEAYWVDACWYGEGGSWAEEVGNWNVRSDYFPRGLKPIGDAAHERGMKFILWFEPERVRKGTRIEREHPEYLLRINETSPTALLNLGHPEARAYITDTISRVIEESGVDIYRQDSNIDPLPFWRKADETDRIGMAEIRHVEGLYAMWDELLRRHPGLTIDNCSSGGRRIDLELTSRSFPLWRSDFSDMGGPSHGRGLQLGDQSQTAGLSQWVPFHTAAVWTFTPYDFRSAMSSGVCLYCNITTEDFPAEDATRAIAELKRLRPFYLGDFYPLLSLTMASHDWCAYQYHRPDLEEGFAVFLRRHESPFPTMDVSLSAIDPRAKYEWGMTDSFDEPKYQEISGAGLKELSVTVEEKPGSVLVQYRKIS